jgi:hypothetical protein
MTCREIGNEGPAHIAILTIGRNGSGDLADATLFGEAWAARYNQEIWGSAPGGVYEAVNPPSVCASAMR